MSVLALLQKLPELCAARLPATGEPIMIKRGVMGYYPGDPRLDVDAFNKKKGVTPEQAEAMLIGSMFGWEVSGADPDTWKNDERFQAAQAKAGATAIR
jgi:hypothetical protein